jgi:hypothetical protein
MSLRAAQAAIFARVSTATNLPKLLVLIAAIFLVAAIAGFAHHLRFP